MKEFHIKELYCEEFQKLISDNFKFLNFFSQKAFLGSIIALDGNYLDYKVPIVIDKNGNSSSFWPVYNISIAIDDYAF